MPATSPMSRSTRWMRAALWPQLRVGVPAGKPRLGAAALFRIAFPRAKFHRVHTFFLPPFPRPCLIRSGRAAEAAGPAGLVVVAAAEVEQVEAEPVVGALEPGVGAAPAEGAPEVAQAAEEVQEAAVEVEPEAQEGPEAARAEARVEARAAAGAILLPTISTTRLTTTRGQSSRRSRLPYPPISRFWLRWPKEQADSRFSTPMTCSAGSSASGENKTSFTSWGMCRATRRREA